MKGNRATPQCGFSASVVTILDEFLDEYATIDVLADADIRQGVKDYSSWPTIPQLYVQGEFVGGADIVREMMASGELATVLGAPLKDAPSPTVTVTDGAIAALRGFMDGAAGDPVVRLSIDGSFRYGMDFDERQSGDVVVEAPGFVLLLDRASARRADGITVDYVRGADGGGGFKIDNPNEPPKVQLLEPEALKRWMDDGKPMEVLDVRSAEERATANIEGTRFLDDEARALIDGFDRDQPVVLFCHHGGRSARAAEHFLKLGFRQVYNLNGGIDAWSRDVDPSVPRY
jgi:monothiol glutaredoxin